MKLSASQKRLFRMLLKDGCIDIRKRSSQNGRYDYAFFKDDSPLLFIPNKFYNRISHLLKQRKGLFTLNLSLVRQLDGRSWIKKQYKKLKLNRND